MRPIALNLLLIGFNVLPLPAIAAGFGDLRVLSGLGEPLRAEITLFGGESSLTPNCFSVYTSPQDALPAIRDATLSLVKQGGKSLLLITTQRAIHEPALSLGVQSGCGSELRREYVILPTPAAFERPTAIPLTMASAPTRSSASKRWTSLEGESLASIAATLRPNDQRGQQRLLRFLEGANPDWAAGDELPAGTEIRLPKRLRLQNTATHAAGSSALATVPRPAIKAPAVPNHRSPDRLEVKEPPKPAPVPQADPPLATTVEQADAMSDALNNRISRLENTLASLRKEVDILDQALALEVEAQALRRQIVAAEAAAPVTLPIASPSVTDNIAHWLTMLVSALAGGAAMTLIFLERAFKARRKTNVAKETPKINGDMQLAATPPEEQSEELLPKGNFAEDESPFPDTGSDISVAEEYSPLSLAEIMLAFGRVRGAAVTLADYIEESSPAEPHAWLMLLDLYRRAGMQTEYNALALRVSARFNLVLPGWNVNWLSTQLKTLEDYPHIAKRLTRTWGSAEALDELYRLVNDRRNGTRNGFPLEVMEEIVLLIRILEEGYDIHQLAA